MQDTLELFPDDPVPPSPSMLEWVAKPGIKLTPAQRAFKELVAVMEAVEQQLKAITDMVDVHRPLFQKKISPCKTSGTS